MTEALGDLTAHTCASCGEQPVGPGGILCPDCKTRIEAGLPGEPASDPPD